MTPRTAASQEQLRYQWLEPPNQPPLVQLIERRYPHTRWADGLDVPAELAEKVNATRAAALDALDELHQWVAAQPTEEAKGR